MILFTNKSLHTQLIQIPLLIEYMESPEKRLLCLHQLPIDLLSTIMRSRVAIHKLVNLIQNLALIGLVTIGPSEYKEKEYVRHCV